MNAPRSSRLSCGTLLLAACCGALHAQDDFCNSPIGESHLLTPGTATCAVIGGATIVTLSNNSEITWDTISLASGLQLEFNFANPEHTVVNRSLGTAKIPGTNLTKATRLSGTLTSNGNVVILSPDNKLDFGDDASVEAGSFIASGLDADPAQFFADTGDLVFTPTAGTNPVTRIAGTITTTRGQVIVVGKTLDLTANIDAAGPVTVATGDPVVLPRTGPPTPGGGSGQIVQGRTIKAGGDVHFVTQNAARLGGEIAPGNGRGRLYVRVSNGGEILTGATGLTVRGTAEFSTPPKGEVVFIRPDEGDNPGALSPAVNELPSLGARRSSARTRPTSSTITARSGTGFTAQQSAARRPQPALAGTTVAPLRKRSFFRSRSTSSRKAN